MSESEDIQQALRRLKLRLSAGEIDESTYQRQRDLVLADLSPEERAALGISATPMPQSTAPGTSLHPGTPTPVGPSGGSGRGLRTSIPSLADLNLQAGSVLLEQWRLIRELGRGGFGAVFEAEELHLKEHQAVKVLDPAMVAKEELLARFRREVSLMRKLVHPRIVRVFDYREDPRQLVALISMELVSGGSVRQLLALARERNAEVPIPLALEILGQTLEALAEAHRQGVIHRDVTPGNVLVAGGSPEQLLANPDRDPLVKLVDFGIAGLVERSELSQKSRVLGTAAYVAPEVLDPSVEVTPAADIYGAGAIGYELLTGKLPLGRFTEPAGLRAAIAKPVNDFVLSLLEAQPASRPAAIAGLRSLHEIRQAAVRLESECQAAEERSQRKAEERQRQEQEAQKGERQEQEFRAAQERKRQAEELRRADEAQRQREMSRVHLPPAPSPEAFPRRPAKRGLSPGARFGLAILIAVVVAGIGWGIAQKRAAERRAAEQRQLMIAEEERVAAEKLAAERAARSRIEAEKRAAAEAAAQQRRRQLDLEQARSEAAETARIDQERMASEERARQQREVEESVRRQREAEAAAQRSREEEARGRRQPSGTWLDGRTSLLWTARDNQRNVTGDGAHSYCSNLSIGNFSDWRLPSIEELRTIYDRGSRNYEKTREGVSISNYWIYSSDLRPGNSREVGIFNFPEGKVEWGHAIGSTQGRALCVRQARE